LPSSNCNAGVFLPAATGVWAEFPRLASFFSYNGSGVMPGRTWVIAADRESLAARWKRLVDEFNIDRKEALVRLARSSIGAMGP
jgi:hypothetical protein